MAAKDAEDCRKILRDVEALRATNVYDKPETAGSTETHREFHQAVRGELNSIMVTSGQSGSNCELLHSPAISCVR